MFFCHFFFYLDVSTVYGCVFSLCRWIIDMEGASGTIYEGERFQLLFKFSSRYPFDSPQVMFTGENIPIHPHVYSNGHICMSILTEDWSPALSVQSVCLSIISMLSSCKEKRRPPDNSFYVQTCNKNPKKTKWWYHGKNIGLCILEMQFLRFNGWFSCCFQLDPFFLSYFFIVYLFCR
uniref:N-terminal E2 ubiquitin-conjugating enzyme n=1 Tax=Electrophorus electricus TaxID=8005 RepID=A0AAY5EXN7_ELEEL